MLNFFFTRFICASSKTTKKFSKIKRENSKSLLAPLKLLARILLNSYLVRMDTKVFKMPAISRVCILENF